MTSFMRLWAFSLIVTYFATLALPAVALATTTNSTTAPSCSISITPSVVEVGGSATISWQSANATGGAITNVGNVGPNGRAQILPPTTRQTTTYIGSFTGPGGTANCSASVQISYGNDAGNVEGGVKTSGTEVNSAGTFDGSAPTAPAPTYASAPSNPGASGQLVECGIGAGIGNSTSCQACNLAQLVQNIINFLIGLSIPIAAVLFAWAGILYFTSGANPTNKETAKKIFSSALIGFLIAITSWLVINTLLHALLDGGQVFRQGNWFTIECSDNRPITGDINKVLDSILGRVNTTPLTPALGPQNYGGQTNPATGCAQDDYLQQDGQCLNSMGGTYRPSSTVNCDPELGCFSGASNNDVAAAAERYRGTDTSAGPEGGNLACAWAVNQILESEGIARIDNNLVSSMEDELRGGRGTPVDLADAHGGDIVIWKDESKNVSHVGICYDENCTEVISNRSRPPIFDNISGTTFHGVVGRIYRINR